MLNLGLSELLAVVVLAVLVVGPDHLPEMVRFLGRQYGKLRRASDELRRAFLFEADKVDADKRAEALRQRRAEMRKRAEEARLRSLDGDGEGEATITPVPRAATGPGAKPAEEEASAKPVVEEASEEPVVEEASEEPVVEEASAAPAGEDTPS